MGVDGRPGQANPACTGRGFRLSRSLRTTTIGTPFEVDCERLRVLMVISRPRGEADVGYRMIARHLLKRLDLVQARLSWLCSARPPSTHYEAPFLGRAKPETRFRLCISMGTVS